MYLNDELNILDIMVIQNNNTKINVRLLINRKGKCRNRSPSEYMGTTFQVVVIL